MYEHSMHNAIYKKVNFVCKPGTCKVYLNFRSCLKNNYKKMFFNLELKYPKNQEVSCFCIKMITIKNNELCVSAWFVHVFECPYSVNKSVSKKGIFIRISNENVNVCVITIKQMVSTFPDAEY